MISSDDSEDESLTLVCAAISQLSSVSDKKRKRRSVWVREWIKRRKLLGAYNSLLCELHSEDPKALKNFLRMSKVNFNILLEKIGPIITKQDTVMRGSIPAGEKLAVTLRFLASGDSYASLEFLYRIPRNTISVFIPVVCQSIYEVLKDDYLTVPQTEDDWLRIQKEFESKWQFPNCIGAIDGKHVAIQAPSNTGSVYFNYKKFFSLILLALVDAECKFIFVDVGANGRAGDAAVFANSDLARALEGNALNIPSPSPLKGRQDPVPPVIVGDDAFPLKPYIMKPYPMRNLDHAKRVFNYRLSRARRVSENAFGILTNRFGVFKKALQVSPDTSVKVVLAAVAIHNFLKTTNDSLYNCQGDTTLSPCTGNSDLQGLPPQSGNRHSVTAMQVRDELSDYFLTDGQVPWQWDMII